MTFKKIAYKVLEKKYSKYPITLKNMKYITNGLIKNIRGSDKWTDIKKNPKILLNKIKNLKLSDETKKKYISLMLYVFADYNLNDHYDLYMIEYIRLKEKISKKPLDTQYKTTLSKMREIGIDMNKMDNKSFLYYLLVFIDETPFLDYRTLIYNPTSQKSLKNYLEDKNNYLTITLNKYKTKARYGKWSFRISNKKLRKYIRKYIKHNSIVPNQYLFVNKRGNLYQSGKFSEFLKSAFKKKTGLILTINDVRNIKEIELLGKEKYHLEKYVIKNFKRTYFNRQ